MAQYFDDLYIELPTGGRDGKLPAEFDNFGIARYKQSLKCMFFNPCDLVLILLHFGYTMQQSKQKL